MAQPKYLKEYQALHRQGQFPGRSVKDSVEDIRLSVKKYGAKTLLDYGCGAGRAYSDWKVHEAWGILPTLYDPASDHHCLKPDGKFDGVICTDVLEHVPEDELPDVLTDIFRYATKFAVFSVSTVPARKRFPDGTNLHVTIRPESWWRDILERYATVPFLVRFRA